MGVVPPAELGCTLGERLTLEGTNWLNLRVMTALDIVHRLGAHHSSSSVAPIHLREALGPR
jgi:hypothetical protein